MLKKLGKLFVFILILVLIGSFIKSFYFSARYPISYEDTIKKYSEEYGLDPFLVAAMICIESGYDKDAISSAGARGLMQIMPETAEWASNKMGLEDFNIDKLFIPEINIKIGTWYLNTLFKEFDNNIELVLAAYNGGIGNVTKWLGDINYSNDGKTLEHIPFKETREYVEKVLNRKNEYLDVHSDAFSNKENPENKENNILSIINNIKKFIKDSI